MQTVGPASPDRYMRSVPFPATADRRARGSHDPPRSQRPCQTHRSAKSTATAPSPYFEPLDRVRRQQDERQPLQTIGIFSFDMLPPVRFVASTECDQLCAVHHACSSRTDDQLGLMFHRHADPGFDRACSREECPASYSILPPCRTAFRISA